MVSTFFLVTGALLLGDALHGSVVTGQYPVTSPAAVVRGVGGIIAIALGYRLKTPASEYAAMPSDEPVQQPNEGDEEFDAEMSPLSEKQFEDLDADDEK
jgi:hypothetical protein